MTETEADTRANRIDPIRNWNNRHGYSVRNTEVT
jgi:hypothetical protein